MSTDTQSHQAVPQKRKHYEFQENDDSSPENPISKPTTTTTPSRGMIAASYEVQNICARCERIDLEKLFNTDVTADYFQGKFIVRLVEEYIASSGCTLCKLFASMAPLDIPDGMDDGYDEGLQLRAFSARSVFCGREARYSMIGDQTLLGVVRFSPPGQTPRFDAVERMTQSLKEDRVPQFSESQWFKRAGRRGF
jgi:hypothetical protein